MGGPLGSSFMRGAHIRRPCCPLAPEIWLCSWPEEGGPRLSASLRPGDPLPRPTHHRCLWRGQMQRVGRERAGSSRLRVKNSNRGADRDVELDGGVRQKTLGVRTAERGDGRSSDSGWPDWASRVRHGGVRGPGRQTKRLRPHRGVSLLAFPSWLLGRSVWQPTPWRGASLPLSVNTAEHRLEIPRPVREPHRLAPKSSTYTPVQSPCVDFALAVVA
jgi:hypothetical protein